MLAAMALGAVAGAPGELPKPGRNYAEIKGLNKVHHLYLLHGLSNVKDSRT